MLDRRQDGNRDLLRTKSLADDSQFLMNSQSNKVGAQDAGALQFRKPEDVKAVVSPEGLVLLHVRKGVFFRANFVGARIWDRLIDRTSVTSTVSAIAEEFDVPCDIVAKDVDEFIASLLEKGFLERQENH